MSVLQGDGRSRVHKMTQARFDQIKQELDSLTTVREREIADLLKEAKALGGFSETPEYQELRTEQAKLYQRIAELREIIVNAEIIFDES